MKLDERDLQSVPTAGGAISMTRTLVPLSCVLSSASADCLAQSCCQVISYGHPIWPFCIRSHHLIRWPDENKQKEEEDSGEQNCTYLSARLQKCNQAFVPL